MAASPTPNPQTVAQRLAHALDAEDYKAAAPLLSPTCTYVIGEQTMVGPEAILESYQANGAWGAANLDRVVFESSVSPDGDAAAMLTYTDHVTHRDQQHTYRCQQRIEVNAAHLICTITHRELPGEKEGLEAFFAKVGVKRK